jgi:hypothetical protein
MLVELKDMDRLQKMKVWAKQSSQRVAFLSTRFFTPAYVLPVTGRPTEISHTQINDAGSCDFSRFLAANHD